jgi:molybdopterin-guanine dinucleotide biosynthesis protein A
VTLAVLAGGKGERLGGVAKGLLSIGGRPFLEPILELGRLCAESILVAAEPAYDRFGVRRVEDVEPGRGAPGGVVTALLAARTPWVLIVACDMPYVTVDCAGAILDAAGDHDVTCYRRGGRLEPMLAVYRASLGAQWRAGLAGNTSLQALIVGVRFQALAPADPHALDSINTAAQLAEVKS